MGDEIEELRYNLKVSFSRMKKDIHLNREEIKAVVELNKRLQEQIKGLKNEIRTLQDQPRGLKRELVRHYRRNKKGLIKQRLLSLVKERKYSLPELKDIVVDEKKYCSKATFYRYVSELKKAGWIDVVGVDGVETVILQKQL